MTDIVKRLRDLQTVFTGANFSKAYHRLGDEMGAAADEIERLRAQVVALQSSLEVGAKEKK